MNPLCLRVSVFNKKLRVSAFDNQFSFTMYSFRKMSRNRRNSDTINGPKMMPMKPKMGRPATTPKIVISGWMFAIFFCRMKRMRLSHWATMRLP